ncbi:Rad24p [Sugiyamaella lignohabitans]|uniref:Rad24p n=1 Tax=Sugiyamaella lignohabitans TaxID=796027 RepID=A0A167DMB9_9ASCO|nr:Rad24p [Sugiyamaella lignohabitans]ANB13066.1 Rad24p [Sugiyamaella lignohabitans]
MIEFKPSNNSHLNPSNNDARQSQTSRTSFVDLVDELSSGSDDDGPFIAKKRRTLGISKTNDSGVSQLGSEKQPTLKSSLLERKKDNQGSHVSTTGNSAVTASSLGSFSKRVRFSKSFTRSTDSPEQADSANDSNDIPWLVKYAPRASSEVAIHTKKLAEIKSALIDMDTTGMSIARHLYRPRLLIISGPTSSSKTSAVTTLANELGYDDILEWHNHDRIENGKGTSESFEDFLTGAMFAGGSKEGSKKLVLVEDLPNISHYETKEKFNLALLQWINHPITGLNLPPLVLIVTEYDVPEETRRYGASRRTTGSVVTSSFATDSVIVERILAKKIINDPRVTRIKVQPINMTLMTKTLKNLVQKESTLFSKLPITKTELDKVIKSLANESGGDLRSAINSLEFWAKWQSSRTDTLKPTTKESSIDLFHALGRIIYGSHKDSKGVPVLSDSVVVESVLKDWENNNRDGTISLAILENYPGAHNSRMNMESICSIAELLSKCDTMVGYEIPTVMSDICFAGTRYKLGHAKLKSTEKPQFRPLVYPRDRKAHFKQLEISAEYLSYRASYAKDYGMMISRLDSVLYDGYFEASINNSMKRSVSNSSRSTVRRRPGGPIQSFSTIRAEQSEENEEDIRNEAVLPEATEPPPQTTKFTTFSDDDIEDSDNED